MLLALDTSTNVGSVAVGSGERLLAEVTVGVRQRAGDQLLPAIEFALRAAGLARADLAGVVVAGGPGSFTGVRIAGALAKSITHALRIPLYSYSGLLALAGGAASAGAVCALFDARRGEVYAACYRFDGDRIDELLAPVVCPAGDVVRRLAGARPLYVGEGAVRYAEELRAADARIAPVHLAVPRAASLLWLAGVAPERGLVSDVASWEPEYVRAPGAERGVA